MAAPPRGEAENGPSKRGVNLPSGKARRRRHGRPRLRPGPGATELRVGAGGVGCGARGCEVCRCGARGCGAWGAWVRGAGRPRTVRSPWSPLGVAMATEAQGPAALPRPASSPACQRLPGDVTPSRGALLCSPLPCDVREEGEPRLPRREGGSLLLRRGTRVCLGIRGTRMGTLLLVACWTSQSPPSRSAPPLPRGRGDPEAGARGAEPSSEVLGQAVLAPCGAPQSCEAPPTAHPTIQRYPPPPRQNAPHTFSFTLGPPPPNEAGTTTRSNTRPCATSAWGLEQAKVEERKKRILFK